jgi:hypothetical protein
MMSNTDSTSFRMTAADRWERKASRRRRPVTRRQSTRSAIILAALAEEI